MVEDCLREDQISEERHNHLDEFASPNEIYIL